MNERAILIGILLFVLVVLPILLVRDHRHKKKVKRIIQSYREAKDESKPEGEAGKAASPSGASGWGMNNSPFRQRKSGLTWGGGNIKASEAKRGTRKKFLK